MPNSKVGSQTGDARGATPAPSSTQPPAAPDSSKLLDSDVKACEGQGRYYDLVRLTCSERKLAAFNCDLNELLGPGSTVLADNQKQQIGSYFQTTLKDFTLKACVDDGDHFTLVALRADATGKLFVQSLDVPKV
jgi:hypothetical protein